VSLAAAFVSILGSRNVDYDSGKKPQYLHLPVTISGDKSITNETRLSC